MLDRRYGWFGLAMAALLLATPAWHRATAADDAADEDEEDAPPPEKTVVVARGVPEDPLDSLRVVDVLDEQLLRDRRPRTVPEALAEVPGAFVQKTNHGGGSPIIRGMVGPQNLILIDGVRLNNSTYRTGPLQYLNTVDSFSLQRIEVMRGPGSVLYGSDAIGGVIELLTADPVPRAAGKSARFVPLGILKGETCDLERSGRGALSVDTEPFGALGGITLRMFDDLRAGGGMGRQVWSGYNELDWDAKLRLGRAGQNHVDILYQGVRLSDMGRTDKLASSNTLTMYDRNDRDLLYGSVFLRLDPIATRLTITPSYQRQLETRRKLRFADETHEEVTKVTRGQDIVDTVGAATRFDTRLFARRLDLLYGAEYYQDFVRSEQSEGPNEDALSPIAPSYPEGSRYGTLGLFVMATGTPLRTERWTELVIYGGARLASFSALAPSIEAFGDVRTRYTGGVLAAGVNLRRRGLFNIGLGYNQGLRAPNLMETSRFGDTGEWYHIPNPELGPERAHTVELSGRLRGGPVTLSAAGYVTLLSDTIVRVATQYEGQETIEGTGVVHNINAGNGRVIGTEVSAAVALPGHLSVGGDVTWTRGNYDDPDEGWVPMSRIPPVFGTVRVGFVPQWRGLFVECYVQTAGWQSRLSPRDLSDARIPEGGTPGWWTLNLRAGVRPLDWMQITIGGGNLTDNLYKMHASGVYGAGATAWISVETVTPASK